MRTRFRLALATRCWPGRLQESLPAIAAAGAQGVQFDVRHEFPPEQLTETGRRDFLHLLGETGLRVASTTFPLKRPLWDEQELDRKLAAIRAAMTFTFSLKASVMTLRIGQLPNEQQPRSLQLLRELLRDLATFGNHQGVTLALSTAGAPYATLWSELQAITTGPLGVDFDPAWCVMNGMSTTEALRAIHGGVAHVQLRDGVRLLDGGGEETRYGDGAVDWLELLALLSEMDYGGWLTAVRTGGDQRDHDLTHALAMIPRLLQGG